MQWGEPSKNLLSRYGLVAMTSASHAEGLRFDPGYLYIFNDQTNVHYEVVLC